MFTTETILDANSHALPAGVFAEVLDLWEITDADNGGYVLFDTANEDDAAEWPKLADYLAEWDHPRVLITYGW